MRPQVILIGNGLIRAFGDSPTSWQDLLENLTVPKYKGKISENGLPNTLQIILRTDGAVNSMLKTNKEGMKGKPVTQSLAERLRLIQGLGPDHILTTNYSYEIEAAFLNKEVLSDYKLSNIQKHTSEIARCEGQYMIHTYNDAGGIPVWHIHGEARKPISIIAGHYWYGSLLAKYKTIIDERSDHYAKNAANNEYAILSWLDAFIMGDVYVLGFGYDIAEIDLWWLLNRKRYENAENKGKLYYYSNEDTDEFNEKEELLKVCGAEVIHCHKLPMPDQLLGDKYRKYLDAAIVDMGKKIKENRRNNQGLSE